jgi:prepilin-type processing-associated H-X9-DG protein
MYDRDIVFSDYSPKDSSVMYRLREGVERLLITDIDSPAASAKAQGATAVLFDEIGRDLRTNVNKGNHLPGGCNVLYMDGHVSFVNYRAEWPVIPAMTFVMGYFRPASWD